MSRNEFSYDALPARVVFGVGVARHRLAEEVERLGVRRVLLICTDRARPEAEELVAPFADRVAGTFTGVRMHVPVEVAEQARKAATAAEADALLCFGGGSATGTAKAVALTSGLPILAVPSTYAGSEVTPVWGLTEGARKTTGTDPVVLPRVVLYDPELTASMPTELAAASGLNAMAHAVEAFWAPRRNPISSVLAAEGIGALADGLRALGPGGQGSGGSGGGGAAGGHEVGAAADLLYGAYLAAVAFAAAGSGLHHKICHALGGAYNLPHAQTHAIVLPHVLAANTPGAPGASARIAAALGVDDPVAGLRELAHHLGIPSGLRDVGLREDQLDEAAAIIAPAVPADNPVPMGPAELRALLRAAWAGAE